MQVTSSTRKILLRTDESQNIFSKSTVIMKLNCELQDGQVMVKPYNNDKCAFLVPASISLVKDGQI